MYLLYLDESGTHGGCPAYMLGGIAIHEHDVYHLRQRLDTMLDAKLPAGVAAVDFELHGAEIKSPTNPRSSLRRTVSSLARGSSSATGFGSTYSVGPIRP
jgi:hypothetical protein